MPLLTLICLPVLPPRIALATLEVSRYVLMPLLPSIFVTLATYIGEGPWCGRCICGGCCLGGRFQLVGQCCDLCRCWRRCLFRYCCSRAMPWKTIMFVTIAIATLDGSCLSWYVLLLLALHYELFGAIRGIVDAPLHHHRCCQYLRHRAPTTLDGSC